MAEPFRCLRCGAALVDEVSGEWCGPLVPPGESESP
jgi:hypothetical protein